MIEMERMRDEPKPTPDSGIHFSAKNIQKTRAALPSAISLYCCIAAFTSEIYYEGRLRALDGLENQAVGGPSRFSGSGLFYVPVEHVGNQSSSAEEVAVVERIVSELLNGQINWSDANGRSHRLGADQILVVAPYNAQVAAISERLPAIRVGTVDKFQGQEAAVVIYSMATSTPEDAPRGMSFLYEPNRFNVATSRARCACVLVAAPKVLEPDCRTPDQMRWANGLCRFRELATIVELRLAAHQRS